MVWNGSGTNTIVDVLGGVNAASGYTLSTFFLLLAFAVTYWMSGGEPTREAFVSATFVTFILAALGAYLEFVPEEQLAVAFVAFIGALVMLFNRN